MRRMKRLLKHGFVQSLIAGLASLYVRFVYLTCRVETDYHPEALPYLNGEKQVIFTFWHGRMIMMAMHSPKGMRAHAMISRHGDGRLISRVLGFFSVKTVDGSSSKGGVGAAKAAIDILKDPKHILSITPDGPRGPYQVAQMGAITVSKHAQVPIIAASFSTRKKWLIASWDKFLVPYPFSTLIYAVSAPLDVGELSDEAGLAALQASLEAITARVDALADGHKP